MKHPAKISLVTLTFLTASIVLFAQDPLRFKKEVDSIVLLNQSANKTNLILFTGSSSIRMWKDLKTSFPGHNVLNMGFGGSEMSDLLYYTDKLILPFKPKQIFIYEGDNDINAGRTIEHILASADSILIRIRTPFPQSEVVFISPKPSLARWGLKDKYEAYNRALKAWTKEKKNVRYADVWTPMLDTKGGVQKDIFIEDGLHLNKKGYSIWTKTLRKYLSARSN
jgi:lysophospholipase L1-like esterase